MPDGALIVGIFGALTTGVLASFAPDTSFFATVFNGLLD
jgi:hypothetical protein